METPVDVSHKYPYVSSVYGDPSVPTDTSNHWGVSVHHRLWSKTCKFPSKAFDVALHLSVFLAFLGDYPSLIDQLTLQNYIMLLLFSAENNISIFLFLISFKYDWSYHARIQKNRRLQT